MTTDVDTESEIEATELLAALAERYRLAGRTMGDLFIILATVASHAAIGTANLLDMNDPEHPDCPLCRACAHIDTTVHNARENAREGKSRGVH